LLGQVGLGVPGPPTTYTRRRLPIMTDIHEATVEVLTGEVRPHA
jgi:hypothetical protein